MQEVTEIGQSEDPSRTDAVDGIVPDKQREDALDKNQTLSEIYWVCD